MIVVKQRCEDCKGSGGRYVQACMGTKREKCLSCVGTGNRYVPQGYTQSDLKGIESLVRNME